MQHHADVQLPAGGEPFEANAQQVLLIVKVQRSA